jgi:hypothetical protein
VRLTQLIGKKVNDNAFGAIVVKNFPPFVAGESDKVSMALELKYWCVKGKFDA